MIRCFQSATNFTLCRICSQTFERSTVDKEEYEFQSRPSWRCSLLAIDKKVRSYH